MSALLVCVCTILKRVSTTHVISVWAYSHQAQVRMGVVFVHPASAGEAEFLYPGGGGGARRKRKRGTEPVQPGAS